MPHFLSSLEWLHRPISSPHEIPHHLTNKQTCKLTQSNYCVAITLSFSFWTASCNMFHFISHFTTKWLYVCLLYVLYTGGAQHLASVLYHPPSLAASSLHLTWWWLNVLCCMANGLWDDPFSLSCYACVWQVGIIPVMYGSKLSSSSMK